MHIQLRNTWDITTLGIKHLQIRNWSWWIKSSPTGFLRVSGILRRHFYQIFLSATLETAISAPESICVLAFHSFLHSPMSSLVPLDCVPWQRTSKEDIFSGPILCKITWKKYVRFHEFYWCRLSYLQSFLLSFFHLSI